MNAAAGINALADATVLAALTETPEVAAQLGVQSLPALSGVRDKLASCSPDALMRRHDMLRDAERKRSALDLSAAAPDAALSGEIFSFFLHYPCFDGWTGTAAADFVFHDYPVKHKDGAHTLALETLTLFHEVKTIDDAETYLARVAALPRVFEEIGESLEETRRRNTLAPRNTLAIVRAEFGALAALAPASNELFGAFANRLEHAESLDLVSQKQFLERAETEIASCTVPAIARLCDTIDAALSDASDDLGVWRLPEGDAYYAYRLKKETTTDFSAEDIHKAGLENVAQLNSAIEVASKRLGRWRGDVATSFAALGAENIYEDEHAARARILQEHQALMAHMRAALRPHFGAFPARDCIVQACARRLEDKRTTCYYPPSLDGARGGLFELNLAQELAKTPAERRIVAYHEAYPGHHMQLALAQENPHTPLFRRILVNAAYIEGWAKYAETLPFALGLDDDPIAELYRMRAELISASNLALDTGIHAKRWRRDHALDFCMRSTGLGRAMADYLVDRVSVTPGQTCAYKIGLDAMRNLRRTTEEKLGANFPLSAFHDLVLAEGAMPLATLEAHARGKLSATSLDKT